MNRHESSVTLLALLFVGGRARSVERVTRLGRPAMGFASEVPRSVPLRADRVIE